MQINIISVFESIVKILAFVFVIFMFKETSLREIILVFIITSILSFMYTIVVCFKKYMIQFSNIKYSYNKDILKEYWTFNLKTFFSSSLKAGNQNIDNLIIGYFLTTETVGIYQVLKKILSPIMIISQPFSMLVYSKLINYFEKNEKYKLKKIIIIIYFNK